MDCLVAFFVLVLHLLELAGSSKSPNFQFQKLGYPKCKHNYLLCLYPHLKQAHDIKFVSFG
jgi:hypothetical protein